MKTILVPIDLEKDTSMTLQFAASFASEMNGRLILIHAVAPVADKLAEKAAAEKAMSVSAPGMPFTNFVRYDVIRDQVAEEYRRQHQKMLACSGELRAKGLDCHSLLVEGDIGEVIINEAIRMEADMILMAPHHHGRLYRAFVPSIFDEVVQKSMIPVMVVPTHQMEAMRSVG